MKEASLSPTAKEKKFSYWQTRTIIGTMFGYAMFYFVRKNLSIAMPGLQEDLGITKADLGLFLTLHGVIYGISKFANGYFGDRANSRIFLITGLLLSAGCNFAFGLSSSILFLGIFWMLNGWVQGMGFPPCAKLLTHWIPPHQLATKMSVWNISHSIGAGLVVIFCGYLVSNGWRWCFFVPASMAVISSMILWFVLRGTPSSVGLPELHEVAPTEKAKTKEAKKEFRELVRKNVFMNPVIWIISIANFFVYAVRYAVLDWGPMLLKESKGLAIEDAGWLVACFELSGIAGMLVAGWATDRFFGGKAVRICVICMLFAALFIGLFWQVQAPSFTVAAALLALTGFFIYGPQALVGIAAANLATNKVAATAVGFTGLFAYASTVVSGWGLGYVAHHYGWHIALAGLTVLAVIGSFVFLLAWKAKANGYDEEPIVENK